MASYRVGLTGGIGAGKSTVAAMFADLGVTVLDADRIATSLMLPGQAGYSALASVLPASCFYGGELDRAVLRSLLLDDEAVRRTVEAVLHPMVYAALASAATDAPGRYCLMEIPLLQETAPAGFADRVLLVDADPEIQIQRVMKRSGWPRAQVESMMSLQQARGGRLEYADYIIDNGGSISALREQVAGLHAKYLYLSCLKKSDGLVHKDPES